MTSSKYKAIIFDDEVNARRLLILLLEEFFREIEVVAEADCINFSEDLITKHQPDLIFLDIHLNQSNGFGLFEKYKHQPDKIGSKVIFVSAYEDQVRRAFNETNAVGFILKPVDCDEFVTVVKKALREIENNNAAALVASQQTPTATEPFLLDGRYAVAALQFIFAREKSIFFRFCDGKVRTAAETSLKPYELPDKGLVKANRGTIVNLKYVKQVSETDEFGAKQRGGIVIMDNDVEISLSVRCKPDFIKFFNI